MNPSKPNEKKWQSIPEFCAEISISRPFFYKLKSEGKAPLVTKLGAKALISPMAKSRWIAKQLENSVPE